MLVRGSLPWHETRTHMATAERREGMEGKGGKTGRGVRKGVLSLSLFLSLSFSLSHSRGNMLGTLPRAWPKAGFTALLVNLAVCAYIFKTRFDPSGWKGPHCERQLSYFGRIARRPPPTGRRDSER